MTNMELFDQARESIMELYHDKSVSIEEAIINLETLRDEIDILIEGLEFSK